MGKSMILRTKFIGKMKVNAVLLVFIFFCIGGNAQINLVPNPSFELHNICCSSGGGGAIGWYGPTKNTNLQYSYANSCCSNPNAGVPSNDFGGGWQYARTGNAYIALTIYPTTGSNDRTYAQTKLLYSLKANYCYYIEFYTNPLNNVLLATNNISLLISDTAIWTNLIINGHGLIPSIPQIQLYGNPIITDTLNWVKVAGIYTAHGGEQFITLGNFKNDLDTDTFRISGGTRFTGYYFEDVSVMPLDSMQLKAEAGRDTTIVKGDSVWIGSRLCGLTNVVWYDAYNNVIDTGAPGLWVKPTNNTFYVIEQDVCGQYSRDTVYVNVQPLPVTLLSFNVSAFKSFNGNTNTLVSWETATEINVSHFNVQRSVDGETFETVGMVKSKGASKYSFIDNTNLSGVVYYRLEVVDKNGSKTYSEIRSVLLTNNDSEFTIIPNPAKDYISISGQNIKEIRISDASGRMLVLSKDKRVDIRNLSFGTYYLTIETLNGQQVVQKLVKL